MQLDDISERFGVLAVERLAPLALGLSLGFLPIANPQSIWQIECLGAFLAEREDHVVSAHKGNFHVDVDERLPDFELVAALFARVSPHF